MQAFDPAEHPNQISFDRPDNPTLDDYAGRAWDIVTNPLDAFTYSVKTGDFRNMGWNRNRMEKLGMSDPMTDNNIVGEGLDQASYFTPLGLIAHGIKDLPYTAQDIDKAIETGDQKDINNALGSSAMNALELLPLGKYIRPKGFKFKNFPNTSSNTSYTTPSSGYGMNKRIGSGDADLMNTGYNLLKQTLNVTDNVTPLVTVPKPSWSLTEPSTNTLQIKSTMKGSPFEKQLSKTGQISVNNIKAHINKASTGKQDKFILQKTLDEKFPGQTKIDYNEFRAAVSDQIVPLEKGVTDQYAGFGIERLGYKSESSINETLTYGNKNDFGVGSNKHFEDAPLGHARTLVSKQEPDVMHVLESQSDYYQQFSRSQKNNPSNLDGLTKAERLLNNQKVRVDEAKTYYERLKSIQAEGKTDIQGQPVYQYQIDAAKQRITEAELEMNNAVGNSKNATQKRLLGNTHEERFLQENMLNAVEKGQSKMRYPTAETAAKIQGFRPIKSGTGPNDVLPGTDPYWVGQYHPEQATILNKYEKAPKMIKKTIGQETTLVTDPKGNTWYEFDIPDSALWGEFEMKSLNAEDWLNKNGPNLGKTFFNKFKRKPKTPKVAKTEPATGTHEEISTQNIINDATKDMPFQGVKEHPFAGSNLMSPLNIQTGINPPIYKLPQGVSQLQLDSFVSQINIGEVPVASIEAVFNSLAKLNPELKTIKGVPKGDIIGYMSGHMPVNEIESTHAFMNNVGNAPNASLNSFTKNTDGIIVDPLENLGAFSRQVKGSFKKGRQAGLDEGNTWLNDWAAHPATQKKVSNLYQTQRAKLEQAITDIEATVKLSEETLQEYRKVHSAEASADVITASDNYIEAAKIKINKIWDKIDDLVVGEKEALSFKANSKFYPLKRQFQDLIKNQDQQIHIDNEGVYYPSGERSGSWISRDARHTQEQIAFTGAHEGTHQWTKSNAELAKTGELDIIFNNINPKLKDIVIKWRDAINAGKDPVDVMGDDLADWGYIANPTEVHARIMELRKHFNLTPGMEVTPQMAQNILTEVAKGTTPILGAKKFAQIQIDAGSFANLFNSLRAVAPILGVAGAAGVAAGTSEEQDGGYIEMLLDEDEIEKYKKGGYIIHEM
jgi:hypothetical protein